MREEEPGSSGLLDGTRVLDLTIWRPGPYATQLLVELGADVVKLEPPGGDPMRVFPALFSVLNAGKRAAVVDLKHEAGRADALELAREADVVVEGFRPGVVGKLGFGEVSIRAINRSVVYCSISGYGQSGPLSALPGHDVNYQAWSGILEPRPGSDAPVVARPPIADLAGGAYAALAICAALARRSRTGEGEAIDVAMADVLATWTGAVPPLTLDDGRAVGGQVPGYGTFRTRDDKWVALGVISEDHLWAKLAEALGLDDVAALTFPERLERTETLNDRLAAVIEARARDELVDELVAAALPIAPVLSQSEMLTAEQFRARGVVADDSDGRPLAHHPLRYAHHPTTSPGRAPTLAENAPALPTWRNDR